MIMPDLLGSSNQYTMVRASSPSLALISEQDSAGNSGMDPSGTNGKNKLKNLNVRDDRQTTLVLFEVNLAKLSKGVPNYRRIFWFFRSLDGANPSCQTSSQKRLTPLAYSRE